MKKSGGLPDEDWSYRLNWIDTLPVPVVIHRDWRILYANREMLNLFCIKDLKEVTGKSVLDFIHPDSEDLVKERISKLYMAGTRFPRVSEKMVRLDGKVVYVEVMGEGILFHHRPAIAAFIWDVTQQKMLERKTREADQLIRTFWKTMPLGVYYKDSQGVYRYINEPYARLAGLSPEEMLGKTSHECWPEPFGARFHQQDLEVVERKEDIILRQAFQRKDGKEITGYHRMTPVFDASGEVIGSLGVFQETTELEEAWASLEEEKERLATLIDASPDIICFKDGEGRWLLANRADLELFGLTNVAYKGKTDLELASDTLPVFRRAFETCRITDEATWRSRKICRFEEIIPSSEENPRTFDVYKIPLFNPDGSRKGLVVIGRDMTQMREMEEKIRESEETTRAILEAIPDFIFTLDQEGRFLTCHTRDTDYLFRPPEEFLGKKIAEILPSEIARLALSRLLKTFETGKRQTFSYTLPIKGTPRRFECRMVPKGKDEVLAIVRDVTERWNAYQKLKASEKKFRETNRLFRLIADNNPDMLWAKDLKSRYIFTNRAIREKLLMADDVDEPLGKDDLYFANRIRAERPDRKDWHTFGELCVNSDEVTLGALKPMRFDEYGSVRGRFLRLDVVKAPLYDEGGYLIGTVGSARDVTREKELEERERKAQTERNRLATVVQQASQAIVITDLKGKIIYVNPAFEKTTGYTYDEVWGKNPKILQSGAQNKKFYKRLWETISAGKTWEGVFINKRKNGEYYYEKAVIFPIRDSDGGIIQYAAVKQDITREKKLEEQFLHAQRMEAIGRLAGGIAHDFNNLLNVIQGFCELGLQKIKKDAPGYREFSTILSAVKRAGNLVGQLLAFSRKQVATPEVLDINETVSLLTKMFQRLLPEDIEISLNLTPGLPFIEADRGQIEQVLMNLVVNARDAIISVPREKREKKITIETGVADIDKSFRNSHVEARQRRYVTMSVKDTGVGMGVETKARIFEPFFTTKKTGEGTGLGLSTVFGIIEQNHGYITVSSEPKKGAIFTIYWPASEKSPKKKVKSDSSDLVAFSGGETILFVEDVDELCEMASEALRSLGYKVYTASNGLDAIKLFKEKSGEIDLVVTDLIMPGMNGTDLVKQLREQAPDLRVLYTSGYSESHFNHDGFLKKDILFLKKPYSIAQLSSKIQEALKK